MTINTSLIKKIAGELSLKEFQVNNAVQLLFDEECTIPFVARYRKEMTGTMDEMALRDVRDRYTYLVDLESNKAKYLKVIEALAQQKPEVAAKLETLRAKFEACQTKQELEDLYLPFKPKRRTRAQVAREKGLEPLLEDILAQRAKLTDLHALAAKYVTPEGADVEAALRVADASQALAGAADILAERVSETAEYRARVRELSFETGALVAKKAADADQVEDAETKGKNNKKGGGAAKYENYFDYRESLATAASHRIMAVRRGEAEKVLKVGIEVEAERIQSELKTKLIGNEATTPVVLQWLEGVVEDAYRRLLAPSIETELRLQLKTRAEEDAIRVFSKNLQNLLMLPPIPGKTVMGVDPGLRTGSKLAVVSDTGRLIECATIYPDLGKEDGPKTRQAKEEITRLIRQHGVVYLAVGNGTGSREIDRILKAVIKDNGFDHVRRLVVNEAGASVYSTDDIAREEFPDLDATLRSAVSIARRLQDPLAELVKINPRSIGVGQYQHDVNVTKLQASLEEVVESCVNKVGVNLNTASYRLLSYVSGIGPALAKNIVAHRDSVGKFKSRAELLEVSGFGPKAFEQAAGFLRVPESVNPLDNSAVHPERYEIISHVAEDLRMTLGDLVGRKEIVETIHWEKYVNDLVGLPTLQDIAFELIKPGRDPREDGARLMFSDEVSELTDLRPGMELMGTVTNVTNFGAFVDIGVHQDGLVHISELSDKYVKDPASVVSVGDVIKVRVLDVDVPRSRISLSCKTAVGGQTGAQPRGPETRSGGAQAARPPQGGRTGGATAPQQQRRPDKPAKQQPSFTLSDLMNKFNRNP